MLDKTTIKIAPLILNELSVNDVWSTDKSILPTNDGEFLWWLQIEIAESILNTIPSTIYHTHKSASDIIYKLYNIDMSINRYYCDWLANNDKQIKNGKRNENRL